LRIGEEGEDSRHHDAHPEGVTEVSDRRKAEAASSARLGREGHLIRLWRPHAVSGRAIGLYGANRAPELETMLGAVPMADWMHVTVTELEPHPNDPGRTLLRASMLFANVGPTR
jgi:muconolactone D-isomerase